MCTPRFNYKFLYWFISDCEMKRLQSDKLNPVFDQIELVGQLVDAILNYWLGKCNAVLHKISELPNNKSTLDFVSCVGLYTTTRFTFKSQHHGGWILTELNKPIIRPNRTK